VEEEEGEGEDEEKRRWPEGGRGGGEVKEEGGEIGRAGEGRRLITIYSGVTAGAPLCSCADCKFFLKLFCTKILNIRRLLFPF
jgi:hypothetical protein